MNIALLIKYLPWLFKAGQTVPEIIAFVNEVKADLQQKEEWTSELDQAFRDSLDALERDPDMQPESR